MKVFISWSGDRSQQIAVLLHSWLKKVIQSLEIFVSKQDIESGQLWQDAINTSLAEAQFGIIVLTRANKDANWILFEAGALAKGLTKSRVCPLVVDFELRELLSPLSLFQARQLNTDDFFHLISDINQAAETSLTSQDLKESYDVRITGLRADIAAVLTNTENGPAAKIVDLPMVAEMILEVRKIIQAGFADIAEHASKKASPNPQSETKTSTSSFGVMPSVLTSTTLKNLKDINEKIIFTGIPKETLDTMKSLQATFDSIPVLTTLRALSEDKKTATATETQTIKKNTLKPKK